ncbi:hypothetical protein [Pantoea sp. B65]|uniref:hypothetical protein n=1 Tax=Pantoea sp. B65 TaxID=2813359 RepID=UPI0039B5F253
MLSSVVDKKDADADLRRNIKKLRDHPIGEISMLSKVFFIATALLRFLIADIRLYHRAPARSLLWQHVQ